MQFRHTAANTSFSYYAGPVTKHPLIQKYLYWPFRSSSSSSSSSKLTAPSSSNHPIKTPQENAGSRTRNVLDGRLIGSNWQSTESNKESFANSELTIRPSDRDKLSGEKFARDYQHQMRQKTLTTNPVSRPIEKNGPSEGYNYESKLKYSQRPVQAGSRNYANRNDHRF